MKYEDVLSEEIRNEVDTDLGVLRAYLATSKRLHKENHPRSEVLRFLQHVSNHWGKERYYDLRGDFVDSGVFK